MTRAELTSLPLTIAILVVAFGSLVAAGLPVLLAFSAVLVATGVNTLASHVVPTEQQTLSAIILMIGMAVGIDYSLFYLRREREERRKGRSAHDALLEAARTSGQAVLISGATVLIAMGGMFVSGNSLFSTIGLGTMIVVLAAMIGSLTVLPALLHRLGDRVDSGRIPFFRSGTRDDGAWGRFIAAVLRRPLVSLLALRRRARRPRAPGARHAHEAAEPHRSPARPQDRADVRAHPTGLPGLADTRGPRRQGDRVDTPQMRRAYELFRQRARATGELFAPFTVIVNPDRTVARIDFAVAGNGDNAASLDALQTLRDDGDPSDREDAARCGGGRHRRDRGHP